jgi:hypothetical protein
MYRVSNWFLALTLALALATSCRPEPTESNDDGTVSGETDGGVTLPDAPPRELTGNERWVQPPGTARITFFVDDSANQTFADGDMVWTGSLAWNDKDNTIASATSWLPTDGPYPLLYDDGPISDGGHEMAGAAAGDHIFSTEVYFKAEEETLFSYGVLNELGFWMWEGANGQFTVPKGSTDTINCQGLTLKAFGDIDLKLVIDIEQINAEFAEFQEMEAPNVYVKGTMTMWAPLQILDAGPEANKGDEAAGDRKWTFVQGLNLGKHTGLLADSQHAQFTFVLAKPEDTGETGSEYKLLTEGTQKGVKDGVKAYFRCSPEAAWVETEIIWELDSWGSTENTTVVAKCDEEPPPPECTPEADDCPQGEKCIDDQCQPWCEADTECEQGEKCIDNQCQVWCDVDGDCPDGFECKGNQCQEEVVVSTPKISSLNPDSGPTDGGTVVTVSGTGFLDGAQVAFGGQAAGGIVVLGATAIECTAPAHEAGKVDVTVTNPDGGTDTFIKGYQYLAQALAPTLDSVEPTSGPVTGGTPVTLHGANFLPGPTVLFGTALAASVEYINSNLVIATTPPAALGTVDVTVINSDSQQAVLEGAFTYVPNQVDYVKLLPPLNVTSFAGQTAEVVYAEAWEPDVTQGEGAGAGLQAEFGTGPETVDPEASPELMSWSEAAYHGENGNNDVFKALPKADTAGKHRFTFRFSMDGTNWVYADATGNLDGFDKAQTGGWEVIELGDGPLIFSLEPASGSVLGGTTVTINGFGFKTGLTLTVDQEEVVPVNVTSETIVFNTLPHGPGPVDVAISNPDPDGGSAALPKGFTYALKLKPSLDGSLVEWEEPFLVAANTVVSDWDPTKNILEKLYLAYDDQNLYVGIGGFAGGTNYILGYVDADYPLGTGAAKMTLLADNTGNGDLDDALSNVLNVTVEGFGAELGFGTRAMATFKAGGNLGDSKFVGWRGLSPADNFPWLDASVVCGETGVEAAIPLASVFPGGLGPNGKQAAIFVKLGNQYGGFDGLSNQTLPEWADDGAKDEVGAVALIDLVP